MANDDRHGSAESILGTSGIRKQTVTAQESRSASRVWWDADADDYQAEHGDFLGAAEFMWCPERLREQDIQLLGEVRDLRILEVGCGSASSSRWLAAQGARPVALDLSSGMLRHAREGAVSTGIEVPLVQASADALPFADDSFDAACSAFGAIPFVGDLDAVWRELVRVLRPGSPWIFSVTHPMRWIFSDDPGPQGLIAMQAYFDRTPYVEIDGDGVPTYVEHHRTLGDYIRSFHRCGLVLENLIEPEWPEDHTQEWGQWSPLRGELFPGTAIFVTRTP